jgi:hypothetical protein
MIAAAGLLSLAFGIALACMAERYPLHVEMLESGGGTLMLAGLALVGSSLPFVP